MSEGNSYPSRVGAALDFVAQMSNKQLGRKDDWQDAQAELIPLRPLEQAAYDSALRMLNQYFTGKMDFEPPSMPRRPSRDDDDDPQAPARLPAGVKP